MAFMRTPHYILMEDDVVQIYSSGQSGGMVLDQKTFDEIVMMRYYNMNDVERRAAIERVLYTQFETGADGIRKASGLTTVWDRVKQIAYREPDDPRTGQPRSSSTDRISRD